MQNDVNRAGMELDNNSNVETYTRLQGVTTNNLHVQVTINPHVQMHCRSTDIKTYDPEVKDAVSGQPRETTIEPHDITMANP